MKKTTAKDYAVALYQLTRGLKGANLERAVKEFTAHLAKTGMLGLEKKIIVEFEKYSKKKDGVIDIRVTSARQINEKTLENIKKFFGGKVEIEQKIDAELLGGITIKTEDKIFDASLKKQLQLLKQKIT